MKNRDNMVLINNQNKSSNISWLMIDLARSSGATNPIKWIYAAKEKTSSFISRLVDARNLWGQLLLLLLTACLSDGGSNSITPTPSPNQNTAPSTPTTTLNYLNTLRTLAGVATYSSNAILDQSATAHTNYQVSNSVMGHAETSGLSGFTGVDGSARAKVAGYFSTSVAEDISFNKATGEELIDDLMTAAYHRMSLLDFDLDEMGIGFINTNQTQTALWSALTTNAGLNAFNTKCAAGGDNITSGSYFLCNDGVTKINVISNDAWLATLRAKSAALVVWPADQSTVLPAFYEESPDPLPACSVSGNPISVQVNPAQNALITLDPASLILTELSSGAAVTITQRLSNLMPQPDSLAAQWTTPNKQWAAAFPAQRLKWGTRYSASVNYTEAGVSKTKNWTFTTRALSSTPIVITQPSTTLSVPGQSQFVIYVPPGDCTASSMYIQANASGSQPVTNIQSIDPHTFSVTVTGATTAVLTITQSNPQGATKFSYTLTLNF